MPLPISESYEGLPDDAPYVPSNFYSKGPRMCPCGHHEGYHDDGGICLFRRYAPMKNSPRSSPCVCSCTGLPADCRTPDEDF